MIKFVKITKCSEIEKYINAFLPVFPHLTEKIESLEAYCEKLSKFANFYAGTMNGETFGIAVFYSNNSQSKEGYITLIGLKSEFRGKGLGKALLEKCEQTAKENGMTKMLLEVDNDNASAVSFYKKNGYSQKELTQRNSTYMQKEI